MSNRAKLTEEELDARIVEWNKRLDVHDYIAASSPCPNCGTVQWPVAGAGALWNGKGQPLPLYECWRCNTSDNGPLYWRAAVRVEVATASTAFLHPKIEGGDMDGVLLPKAGGKDVWFPRGSISVIGGSSGAGKSTVMLPLLRAQEKGDRVFGHEGGRLRPLMLCADRGPRSNRRTLERLGMLDNPIPFEVLPAKFDGEAVQAIRDAIEKHLPLPQVVFVEGADMLVSDPNKGPAVGAFLHALQSLASHYHIALVLSVGAAKTTPKTRPDQARDRLFGSVFWGRMSDTIAVLDAPGDGTTNDRNLTVLHRDTAAEKFRLTFSDGRLVETDTPATVATMTAQDRAFNDWLARQTIYATKGDAKRALPMISGSVRKLLFAASVRAGVLGEPDSKGRYPILQPQKQAA